MTSPFSPHPASAVVRFVGLETGQPYLDFLTARTATDRCITSPPVSSALVPYDRELIKDVTYLDYAPLVNVALFAAGETVTFLSGCPGQITRRIPKHVTTEETLEIELSPTPPAWFGVVSAIREHLQVTPH